MSEWVRASKKIKTKRRKRWKNTEEQQEVDEDGKTMSVGEINGA